MDPITSAGVPTSRVRFIEHRGREILLIDCTACPAEEMVKTYEDVRRIVTSRPLNSMLTLSDWRGAKIDKDTIARLKIVAAYDKPHVIRAALVGAESIPEALQNSLEAFSARRFPRFDTREAAMDWLVTEETA